MITDVIDGGRIKCETEPSCDPGLQHRLLFDIQAPGGTHSPA
jgi:hypothetical protein